MSTKFNKFFYDTQHKRMLNIAYILMTKEGVAWLAFVWFGFYFGFSSIFFVGLYVGVFVYIYNKKFYITVQDRENLFVFAIVRKYLGIKGTEI